ncbi:MAG: ribonuclease III [Candidatus Daviesbacteria bacterium]|nr:ribonuclease III [Candidatus Daviesbacteria bacterium]
MDQPLDEFLEKQDINPRSLVIYQTAFTHRSYLNETKKGIESNERLEFLGDSILSFIISTFLYKSRSQDDEGGLTNLRAYIVNTKSLSLVSERLGLGKLLKLSKGEELGGGRTNPQLLANTYEALLGAMFLDLGLDSATRFIETTLLPSFKKELEEGAPKDAKSELQELVQSKFQISPKYKILDAIGPDHAKEFTVGVFVGDVSYGAGSGSSKQLAEEVAAREAIHKLTQV